MTITAIKQQERLKGRYSIYVDETYAFSLSADALLQEGLHTGMELTTPELQHFKKLSADDKAYGLALAYIAWRIRSQWELTDYFRRKGYSDELSQQLLRRLQKLGLVDDGAFAEAWVRNRRLLKSVSRRRLQQELRQKRVADEYIAAVLNEDLTNEQRVLHELVVRKRRQSRYQDDLKLMRYLVGQGFNYDDVKHALEQEGGSV